MVKGSMSINCCASLVPHPDSSFKAFSQAVTAWQERLQAGLSRSIQASDQTMGHLEEEILRKDPRFGAQAMGRGGSEKSRSSTTGLSGLRRQIDP
jgi:hypothetical protein